MKVETYIITWNREDTIHLTLKHYLKLGKVILYDNFSDDRTREIAESMGADVRLFGTAGVLDDGVYLDIKNREWKRSSADWVIVVDDDEILYHPDLEAVLKRATAHGDTIFYTHGFNIHSDEMPKDDWTEIMTGEPNENYSKTCIFNPQKVKEIRYNYGCHVARPVGHLQYSRDHLAVLHYRDVGGIERLLDRHKKYRSRLSETNKRYNLGHHYSESEDFKRKEWEDFSKRSGTFTVDGML